MIIFQQCLWLCEQELREKEKPRKRCKTNLEFSSWNNYLGEDLNESIVQKRLQVFFFLWKLRSIFFLNSSLFFQNFHLRQWPAFTWVDSLGKGYFKTYLKLCHGKTPRKKSARDDGCHWLENIFKTINSVPKRSFHWKLVNTKAGNMRVQSRLFLILNLR